MKTTRLLAFAILLCGLMGATGASAQTAEQPGSVSEVKLAMLDLNTIRVRSLVVKSIREQVGKFRKVYQQEIQKAEEELRAQNQELRKKKAVMTNEAFTQERRKFEQRVVEVQRMVQIRRRALDKTQADAMVQVEAQLNKIITEIAVERGLSLVLRRNQAILASRSLEITDEVLKRLDETLPTVQVAQPEIK